MELKKCMIKMIWSGESGTWYAESDDVPGLATGAQTFDSLVERVKIIALELLEDNLKYSGPIELQYDVERIDVLPAVS
jgi:predicted RNase H-like HicB family nuclease